MLSNRIHRLAPPPRPVPLQVACATLLGLTGTIGGIFLLSGLAMIALFGFGPDLAAEVRLAVADKSTIQGTVTEVVATGSSENDMTIYEVGFTFYTLEGQTFTGQSYTTQSSWSVEDRVTIEYITSDPAIARIEGTRAGLMPFWAYLMLLTFPATGAGMFFWSTLKGWQRVMLLRYDETASARIISQSATNMSINDVPVMEYAYEFRTAEGETCTGSSRALPSEHIGDEAEEPVLYLPTDPYQSVLVDTLPLRVPLDVNDISGQWTTPEGYARVIWYTLIWAAIAGFAIYSLLGVLNGP